MEPNGSLTCAVIGVGHLGFHHARILSDPDLARLVGVVDVREDRAREVAEKFKVRAYSSVKDLPAVDVAVVAVPTSMHAEVAVELLQRGVHVFVEKPIAQNLREARRIAHAARRFGRTVQVGHVERFNPALYEVRDRVTDPRFIEIHRLSPFPERATDVSVVLDVMIHDLDIVLQWMADRHRRLLKVSAVGTPVLTDRLDIVNARLEFQGGVVANVTASRISAEAMRKIRVFQPDSYLSVDTWGRSYEFYRKRSPGPLRSLFDLEIDRKDFQTSEEPLRRELRHFLNCLRESRPAEPSAAEATRALSLALRIERLAARSARPRPRPPK
ncbi:MAG: hypothetical protein A3G34_07415 [Candidatus Lindowbacteria bacterium RIFCSPLOWO2_12_FULL_62_27]|nr:MAG: hypothetical protein A3G34_07415 [Candidatus Lindowbacteria bacterium RIFCSPLOWO2_12_FULL_62_27]OGH61878.1 MAG: hypothetical protein A3I06_16795 [Candidatus Lindowbacteria bacterium RIFCSPLOWO2_02_FULL_62_12]